MKKDNPEMTQILEFRYLLDNAKIMLFDKTYVSEAIGDDYYAKWTPSTPVFISAQTGAGKNYFIEEVLIPHAVRKKHTVLILSNRVALGRQEKSRLAEIMDAIAPRLRSGRTYKQDVAIRSGELLDEFEDFGPVTIKSYQGFMARPEKLKPHYDYVIFDECHYFLADAKFNKHTYDILITILSRYMNSVRVYMSSTLSDVAFSLLELEKQWRKSWAYSADSNWYLPKWLNGFQLWPSPIRKGVVESGDWENADRYEVFQGYTAVIYEIERDYSYLECKYIKCKNKAAELEKQMDLYDEDEPDELEAEYVVGVNGLISLIQQQVEEENKKIASGEKIEIEKWIVFVASKSKGWKIQEELGDEIAVFITTDSKRESGSKRIGIINAEETYKDICNKEKFSQKVLICTSVLDNGINIKDRNVKNIVISVFDKVTFLQMLGRKRIEEGERLNLYIHEYSTGELKRKLTWKDGLEKKLERIETFKSDQKTIMNDICRKDTMFYWQGESCEGFTYNRFAEEKLLQEKEYLWSLLKPSESCENKLTYDRYIQDLSGIKVLAPEVDTFEQKTILEQLSWMGIEQSFDVNNYIEAESEEELARKKELAKVELLTFLEESCIEHDVPASQSEVDSFFLAYGMKAGVKEQFAERFKDLTIRAFGLRDNDRSPNRPYKNIAIRDVLRENDLPYELLSRTVTDTNGARGKMWVLIKKKSLNPE